jgi:hypothetical protein
MGRKPEAAQAMTGAERQTRYRARHDLLTDAMTAMHHRSSGKRRAATRVRRWTAAVDELVALQAEYAAWLQALPEATRDGPTGEALQAIVDLDLDEIIAIQDERARRRFAAAEALAAGRGGVTTVAQVTCVARSTIDRGLAELRGDAAPAAGPDRVRRKGGGRRPLVVTDSSLLADLKELVDPSTRGDPMAPLLWTARSLRNLAGGLRELGHRICRNVVADLLRDMGLQFAGQSQDPGRGEPSRP